MRREAARFVVGDMAFSSSFPRGTNSLHFFLDTHDTSLGSNLTRDILQAPKGRAPMEKFIMGRSRDQGCRDGFSLIEVTLVVAIAMVVTATAIPSITTVVGNAKLRASMTSLSGLLQNCRMTAVQQNKAMTTYFQVQPTGLVGYVKLAGGSTTLAKQDPQVDMQAPISKLIP